MWGQKLLQRTVVLKVTVDGNDSNWLETVDQGQVGA